MAEKHKSKYKAPKDFEKSQKPKARKDLKDYTMDDKDEKLNPKTTGEKALGLRKTDKPVQDDGKLYPKYNADDRLYKDIEDGEYDPKDAAKKMKKRIETEKKDVEAVLKDKIENLTSEQKERLVREYVRRKIIKVLYEQPTEPEEPVDPNLAADPTAVPGADTGIAPATDAAAPSPEMAAPTPLPATDTAAPSPEMTPPAADASTTPATAPATAPAAEPETPKIDVTAKDLEQLTQGGTVTKVKKLNSILDKLMQDSEIPDQRSFYQLLARLSIKKMRSIQTKK